MKTWVNVFIKIKSILYAFALLIFKKINKGLLNYI